MAANKPKKRQLLRNNEYYDTQTIFDDLYERSQDEEMFTNLMGLIVSEQNIMLAYRSIKKNKGSKTKGVNSTTIVEVGEKQPEELIAYVRQRLQNFHPQPVRRVEIPKPDGCMRPLGIPTMEDRLIQQCIKQVLEPICEAKFYKHSYGFRPNRSAHHAVARAMFLANISKYRYVVDVDIRPLAKLSKTIEVADAGNEGKAKSKTFSAVTIAFREDAKSFEETDGVFNKDAIF